MEAPPPFQEASRCDVCHCSFTTFRRRHHCRCCGRTLCHDHSSYHMALPHYGIHTDVRVCYECFNKSSSGGHVNNVSSPGTISSATGTFSKLNLGKEDASLPAQTSAVQSAAVPECKCGMPLCICEAPKQDPAPQKIFNTAASTAQSNPRPKKSTSNQQSAESSAKKAATTSTSNSSSFLNLGQVSSGSNDMSLSDYDVSGEGLREAIKCGDVKAVRKLLSQAALFNQTEIALILMDNGANVQSTNGQGETPLDCAPTMLQYKMRQKMEELAASHQ